MWHLKTRLGTFWVVESESDETHRANYTLGVDDYELGKYDDINKAVRDVYEQETGHYSWDSLSRIRAPKDISEWRGGEPTNWQ